MASSNFSSIGFLAGDTIAPATFVKQDTTADLQVLQAGAGTNPLGISTPSMRDAPLSGNNASIAATVGQPIAVFGPGNITLLSVSGSVTPGDRLKPSTGGVGITTLATGGADFYGAVALESGTTGAQIKVYTVQPGTKTI